MFLHAGASLHGHEYSNRPSNPQTAAHNLRAPLLRSAFTPPKQRVRTADGTIAPALRQRPASDYIPRDPSPVVRFRVPQEDDDAPPPTPATHEEPVSESELSDATFSTDGPAAAARPAHRRRGRRVPRKSTTYYLGYPAPRIIGKTKVIQKVFLPRLLLQLQKVAEDGRSYPVLEIFPATRIAGPVVAPRLARRFPGIFGVKRHLGYDDIVLVRRDDSDLFSDRTEGEGEEGLENRNLLAVYSPLKHSDEAEIVLDDGSVWVAKPLANGSYDFVHTDAEGNTTTARWARRHTPAITPTSVSTDPSTPSTPPPPRYTFSIINPSTRRHPVMATLTPSSLAVQDTYTSVSASHSRHPPITRIGRSQSVTSSIPTTPSTTDDCESDSGIGISSSDPDPSTERTVYVIDPPTKMLIAVTALWVALRAGWSQSYGPGSESASSSSSSSTPAAPTPTPSNASTFPLCSRRTSRSRRNTWTRSSSTCDPVQQSQPSESSSSASSPSPAPTAPVSRLGAFKRHSLPAQHPQKQQQQQPPSLCCSASVPGTPLAGSRTSTPVSVASAFAGGFINAGAASATRAEVRNGNANSTTNGTTYASDSEAAKAPPRRATSTGAAFMQRRLLATSSSTAPSAVAAAGAGVGVGNEADGVGEFPFPVQMQMQMQDAKRGVRQSLPLPPGLGMGAVQTQRQVSGRKRRGENPQIESEKGIFEDCGVTSVGAGKRGGVRARFSRWISKIGSGSSR